MQNFLLFMNKCEYMQSLNNRLMYYVFTFAFLFFLISCGDSGSNYRMVKTDGNSSNANQSKGGLPVAKQEFDDTNADPDVPAEKGGKGFAEFAEKNGWQTNMDVTQYGSPNAKKGGKY